MLWTTWGSIGALLSAVAVALGAFGAHMLKTKLDEKYFEIFEVGVRYHLYHSLAILAVALFLTRIENLMLQLSAFSFLLGIFLFSGSLYLYCWYQNKSFAMVTPFGGAFFILAWLCLAWGLLNP